MDLEFSGNNLNSYLESQRRRRTYNSNCTIEDTGLRPHSGSETDPWAFSASGNYIIIDPMTPNAEYLNIVALNKNKFVLNVDGELYFFK
jgi:hypothetical protein